MFEWLSNIFKPAVDLIDSLHVSEEEKGKLKNEFARIQAGVHAKSVELMSAEAKSDHWIVAAWRPICALTLFVVIVLGAYGIGKVPPEIYSLAEMFLGVYGGGRSIEKVAKVIKQLK